MVKGEAVRVTEFYKGAGDLLYFFERNGSSVVLMLDASELPLEDRKKLLL